MTDVFMQLLRTKKMQLQVCKKEPQSKFDEDVSGNCGVCRTRICSLKDFLRQVAIVAWCDQML